MAAEKYTCPWYAYGKMGETMYDLVERYLINDDDIETFVTYCYGYGLNADEIGEVLKTFEVEEAA